MTQSGNLLREATIKVQMANLRQLSHGMGGKDEAFAVLMSEIIGGFLNDVARIAHALEKAASERNAGVQA